MKTITREWLEKQNACPNAKEWVLSLDDRSIENIYKVGIEQDKLYWISWGLCRLSNRTQRIKFAVYAAKQVLPIFEKKYPDDKRPLEAIQAAEKCINNDTQKNRRAATHAADAAYAAYVDAADAADIAAADAAYAVAYAAYAAAYTAYPAYAADAAAVYAAEAAEAAAVYAAEAADAAKSKMKLKILKYGLSLIQGEVV